MWLRIPTSVSPQESEDSISGLNEGAVAKLAQYASWREKLRPQEFWRRAWLQESCLTYLSGLTLRPSMAQDGVEKWKASLPDIPASHLVSRVSNSAPKTPDISGPQSNVSLEKSDQLGASSKMWQATFGRDTSTKLDHPSKDLGIAVRSRSSERLTWARLIDESDSSSSRWQTPIVPGGGGQRRGGARADELLLPGEAENWSAPIGTEDPTLERLDMPNPTSGTDKEAWSTPLARDRRYGSAKVGNRPHLGGEAEGWVAAAEANEVEAKMAPFDAPDAQDDADDGDWRTPLVTDNIPPALKRTERNQLREQVVHMTAGLHPPTETGPISTPNTGQRRLNWKFVEWLMGLPAGWVSRG